MNNAPLILVPVDFREESREALMLAANIAEKGGGHVALLHVLEKEALREEAQRRLAAMLEETEVFGEAQVVEGNVDEAILREAAKRRAALLILGTHRRSGPWDFSASVTNRVLSRSPVPVLVTKRRGRALKRILVSTELSVADQRMVRYVRELFPGTSCTVLHVLYPRTGREVFEPEHPEQLEERRQEVLNTWEQFKEGIPGDRDPGFDLRTARDPETGILEAVREHDGDLIVVGAKHHGFLFSLLSDDTAAEILEKAACDVLFFPR